MKEIYCQGCGEILDEAVGTDFMCMNCIQSDMKMMLDRITKLEKNLAISENRREAQGRVMQSFIRGVKSYGDELDEDWED